jgi:hypothetical protein
MAWEFVTEAQVRSRLSSIGVDRLYDDDGDGFADTSPLTQLRLDATSKVAGYLRGITSLEEVQSAIDSGEAHEVVRLTLDVCEYMAVKRHPAACPGHDWVEMMKAVNSDLSMLRKSFTKVDTEGAPNEPSNVGGDVIPDVEDDSTTSFYRGGFGMF